MPTSNALLNSVVSAVKTIKLSRGYLTEMPDANIYSRLTPYQSLQQPSAASYPKLHIISEGAEYEDLPSRRITKLEKFVFLAVFAQDTTDPMDVALDIQVANFVDDFERWVDINKQCGGSDIVKLLTCSTDSETPNTEAIAMFEVSIQYKRTFV